MTISKENNLIQFSIISFWWFFWLFNLIDKIIPSEIFLWVGTDRFAQFSEYFSSIGIENSLVVTVFLAFSGVIEAIALLFISVALFSFLSSNKNQSRKYFFQGILISLFLFTFFSIGDQIFGDREELLEHSIFWMSLIISWFVYSRLDINTSEDK